MRYFPEYLNREAQQRLLADIMTVVCHAPFFTPAMPRTGKPFSVQMTNCGPLGWVSDKEGGYRYQAAHPVTGGPWPDMPPALLDIWREVAGYAAEPEACLVNYYRPGTRMGLHRDEDEADFEAPVVSVSLGDTAKFRIGGLTRKDPTRSFDLRSGDVLVLHAETRLAYHGVDRIMPGTSTLLDDVLPDGGRLNLTLRRVN